MMPFLLQYHESNENKHSRFKLHLKIAIICEIKLEGNKKNNTESRSKSF